MDENLLISLSVCMGAFVGAAIVLATIYFDNKYKNRRQ